MRSSDEILVVARAHGTTVAAQWAGRSRNSVKDLRKRVDGYDRGRGHPSKAEMDAMPPRLDCICQRCVEYFEDGDWRFDEDVRSDESTASKQRYASIGRTGRRLELVGSLDEAWRADGACRDHDINLWFPQLGTHNNPTHRRWNAPRAICEGCPVRVQCANFAEVNQILMGMFGGITPEERLRPEERVNEEMAA